VSAITSMGHSLRMPVAAEGVETAEQASFLLRLQIDQMQGPYLSDPLPADACTELMRAGLRAFVGRRPAVPGNGHGSAAPGNGHGPVS